MNHERDDAIEALLRQQFDGPAPDEGFSQRVMVQVPPRRRRIAWPLWSGVVAGAVACWLALRSSPLLHTGWQEWPRGQWSASVITILLVMLGMVMLALAWSVAEADEP